MVNHGVEDQCLSRACTTPVNMQSAYVEIANTELTYAEPIGIEHFATEPANT